MEKLYFDKFIWYIDLIRNNYNLSQNINGKIENVKSYSNGVHDIMILLEPLPQNVEKRLFLSYLLLENNLIPSINENLKNLLSQIKTNATLIDSLLYATKTHIHMTIRIQITPKITQIQKSTIKINPKIKQKSNKFTVCSLNISYSTVSNVVRGSEKEFVKLCQKTYPKYGGWADSSETISQCTMNSINLLKSYDLLGIQEFNHNYINEFNKLMPEYNFIHGQEITVGYNRKIMGNGKKIQGIKYIGIKGKVRGIQAIYFDKHRLLFINLHAPHNINILDELTRQLDKIRGKLTIQPKRVIIAGDFNDYNGTLLNVDIEFMGLTLKIPDHKAIKTCCYDSNYNFYGDYIFDSDRSSKYGFLPNYKRFDPPLSDHDPVILF